MQFSIGKLIVFIIIGFCAAFIYKKITNKYPKKYRVFKSRNHYRINGNNRTQRYNHYKLPENIDHIIIGSGISGLSCAAALAKNGKVCLVLEKHDIVGGSIHVFNKNGVEFDTGLHYVGEKDQINETLNFLGDNDIEWNKLGENNNGIFDTFHFGDKIYHTVSGKDKYYKSLSNTFPNEKNIIKRYLDDIQRITKGYRLFFTVKAVQNRFIRWILRKTLLQKYFKLARMSTYDFVSSYTQNKELVEVLCALSIDSGPPPRKQSAFVHIGIANHFLEGAYYPKGGSQIITESLIRTIEKSGGRVFTQVEVISINTNADKIRSITVRYGNNQKDILCNSVISSVGIPNTYRNLLHNNHKTFDRYMNDVTSNVTYFFVYVCLNGTKDELGLKDGNIWTWPNTSCDEVVSKFEEDPMNNDPVVFIASSSSKDDELWQKKYPGKSVVEVISWATKNMFSNIDDGSSDNRSNPEYNKKKELFQNKLLEYLYRFYPKTKDKIESVFSSTPSTVKHYLNSYNGEVYGMDANLNKFDDYPEVRPKTSINGLWLTGQDLVSAGFLGSLMSGVLTANCVEGYGDIFDLITGRNLIDDLKKL